MPSPIDAAGWTLIFQAAASETAEGLAALNQLCGHYWKPMYAYARSRGYSPADAEDLTQSFFQRLLARELHAQVDPERGCFRAFLLHAMRNFINTDHRDAARLKRGGGTAVHLDVEDVPNELTTTQTPETFYDQKWALAVIGAALENLGRQYTESGHADRFTIMSPLLFTSRDGDSQARAEQLGVSISNFRKILHQFRHLFGAMVRREVRKLVANPSEVDGEIAHLMRALEG